MIKFTELDVITEEHVAVLNEKLAEKKGIREILRSEMGAKTVTKRVRDEVDKLTEKLRDLGYILEDGVYKLKQQELKNEAVKGEIETKIEEVLEKKEDVKVKKTYMTKKQKEELEAQRQRELEEKLKENPFYFIDSDDVLKTVDFIACDIAAGKVKNVGVYTIDEVSKSFKTLQDRFYYIPSYLLISASVNFTQRNLDSFMTSKWVDHFSKIYQKDKQNREVRNKELNKKIKEIEEKLETNDSNEELEKELKELNTKKKRKQMNVKMNEFVADTSMYFLKKKFPFLSQSDIVVMCIYAFSECINENLKPQEKVDSN